MSRRFKNLSLLLGPLAVALVPLLLLAQPPLFNYAPGARQATRQVSGVQAATSVRGGAAWTPASIAGLLLWLDANQITGLNDGDAVATWSDLSGNAQHATQATASARPTYKTSIIGGKPVVRFDGVDDYLRAAGFTLSQPMTVFLVVREPAAQASYHPFFDGLTARVALMRAIGDVWAFAGTAAGLYADASPLAACYFQAEYNGASSKLYKNTVLKVSGNFGANALTDLVLGCGNSGGSPGDFCGADIAEMIIYNSILAAGDASLVNAYFAEKYGL